MLLWFRIGRIEGAKIVRSPDFGDMVLLPVPGIESDTADPEPDTYWMISRHEDQTKLATALRKDEVAQQFVAEHRVRLGFRNTDVPPIDLEFLRGRGETLVDKELARKDFRGDRQHTYLESVDDETKGAFNRETDQKKNVKAYWQSQTPHSHHIIEYNNLHAIGQSNKGPIHRGPLDHSQLPCVLLAAEFHKRYISPILQPHHGKAAKDLSREMEHAYWSLYATRGTPLNPLWEVSRLILLKAGLPVTIA